MITTTQANPSQNATQARRRSVHQRSLPNAFNQACERSTTQRRPACTAREPRGWRCGRPCPIGQHLPAGRVVVAGVKAHGRRLVGQRPEPVQGVQRGGQQPVVASVGAGGDRAQRDAAGLHAHRALGGLLAAVDRAGAGNLATAGRLGGAAVHDQVLQLQAELAVVGAQGSRCSWSMTPTRSTRRDGGAACAPSRWRGDALVGAAEHQDLQELVEDDSVRDPRPMAAQARRSGVGGVSNPDSQRRA